MCIVIDTWMLKAMGVHDRHLQWVELYEMLEEMLLELAASFYMTPSKFQAFVWVLIRGKVD
jgi:thermostable 8-oxoguanine DNA glycosylase